MEQLMLKYLLMLAGLGQIVLVACSLMIPKMLNWKQELSKTSVLIKQIFWTYAGYILVINFCFGLVSLVGSEELINGSFLAKTVTAFIAVYWISRILIQFFYFDTSNAPKGMVYKWGEFLLVFLFVFLAAVYIGAFVVNFYR